MCDACNKARPPDFAGLPVDALGRTYAMYYGGVKAYIGIAPVEAAPGATLTPPGLARVAVFRNTSWRRQALDGGGGALPLERAAEGVAV